MWPNQPSSRFTLIVPLLGYLKVPLGSCTGEGKRFVVRFAFNRIYKSNPPFLPNSLLPLNSIYVPKSCQFRRLTFLFVHLSRFLFNIKWYDKQPSDEWKEGKAEFKVSSSPAPFPFGCRGRGEKMHAWVWVWASYSPFNPYFFEQFIFKGDSGYWYASAVARFNPKTKNGTGR